MTSRPRSSSLYLRTLIAILVAVLVGAAIIAAAIWGAIRIGHPVGMVVAAAGILTGVVYLTARFIHHQLDLPLRQLMDSAKEIARGNFDHKVHVTASDELNQLSRIFNYMTLELKRMTDLNINQIIREQIKTEAILRNIADGVIVSGPFDEVLLINNVVEKWFGIREKDILACSLTYFIPDLKPLLEATKQSDEGSVIRQEIETHPDAPQNNIVLSAHASKIIDDRELLAIVIVLRNITKEKEVDRLKTELVSVVAHELRSPLTSIAGFSEVVSQDKELSPGRRQEYMEIIRSESARLADMIDKFLNISRIESGQTVVNRSSIDLVGVVEGVLSVHRPLAERKNIEVELATDPDMPPAFADPDLMGQLIINLFSNAVKYSPEDTKIRMTVTRTPDHALIRIRDQGFGMSKENVRKLFTKFFRAKDDKRLHDIEGSGLGLAFVKEIVTQHGGKITVESELGKGSVFSVYIPLAERSAVGAGSN